MKPCLKFSQQRICSVFSIVAFLQSLHIEMEQIHLVLSPVPTMTCGVSAIKVDNTWKLLTNPSHAHIHQTVNQNRYIILKRMAEINATLKGLKD